MKVILATIFLITGGLSVNGQETFTNTIHYSEEKGSPNASIEDLAWISGHWRGIAFGGVVEEIWSPPLNGSMMCAFKMANDDGVVFYELCTISEIDETLILRLKHFNANLTGWEEKDVSVDFKLVKLEANKAYFDDFTFERISDSEMNIYVVVEDNGKQSEMKFPYSRYSKD